MKSLTKFQNYSKIFTVIFIVSIAIVLGFFPVVAQSTNPSLVLDMPGDSDISGMGVYKGELLLGVDGGDGNGRELWKYNGTAINLVEDIYSGATESSPQFLTVFGDDLYFNANSLISGYELHKYDSNIVSLIENLTPGSTTYINPRSLAVYDGALYFGARENTSIGSELYKFDGTSISLVVDIYSTVNSSCDPLYLTVYNDDLYFACNGGDGRGRELWKYNSTTNTASHAADIYSGSNGSHPSFLSVYDGNLYFSANGGDGNGHELWKFDGATASLVKDIRNGSQSSGIQCLTVYNNQLFFGADGGDGNGNELWVYDSTTDSANLIANIRAGSSGSWPRNLTVYNSKLYFSAYGGDGDGEGNDLWVYDSNFSISDEIDLPNTGFTQGEITLLPEQPIAKKYDALGTLWLEIPEINVETQITGVPLAKDGWDLAWLSNQAGWLEGTAFPSWSGNSAITAHVVDANGQPGLFTDLGELNWGDEIIVHAYGQDYVYEVRSVEKYVRPDDTSSVFKHEEYPWLTLITCRGYDEDSDSYRWRVMVRAVQTEIY